MKKYLGSSITAYCAVALMILSACSIGFGIFAVSCEKSIATFFLLAMCLFCCICGIRYLWICRFQLLSWGNFRDKAVSVHTLFQKEFLLDYKKCRSCGIGMYRHAFMNSQNTMLGSNVYFIFMSLDCFPEKYRTQINLWKPSQQQIKVQFSKKLYDYLLEVLPPKQSVMLRRDYEKYIESGRFRRSNHK